jgi:hypothetical protein
MVAKYSKSGVPYHEKEEHVTHPIHYTNLKHSSEQDNTESQAS